MKFLIFTLIFSLNALAGWQDEIIERARMIYSPVAIQTFQKPLVISISEDSSVSASADHTFTELKVVVNTGLLKSNRLTPDSLRMVLCHELGHLFGGDPRKNIPMEWDGPVADDGLSFLSAEGQADYFAGLECFRKLAEDDSHHRTAKAGYEFLTLVKEFPISCSTPDTTVATEIIRDSYPSRQCRLDTIISAANEGKRPHCWHP